MDEDSASLPGLRLGASSVSPRASRRYAAVAAEEESFAAADSPELRRINKSKADRLRHGRASKQSPPAPRPLNRDSDVGASGGGFMASSGGSHVASSGGSFMASSGGSLLAYTDDDDDASVSSTALADADDDEPPALPAPRGGASLLDAVERSLDATRPGNQRTSDAAPLRDSMDLDRRTDELLRRCATLLDASARNRPTADDFNGRRAAADADEDRRRATAVAGTAVPPASDDVFRKSRRYVDHGIDELRRGLAAEAPRATADGAEDDWVPEGGRATVAAASLGGAPPPPPSVHRLPVGAYDGPTMLSPVDDYEDCLVSPLDSPRSPPAPLNSPARTPPALLDSPGRTPPAPLESPPPPPLDEYDGYHAPRHRYFEKPPLAVAPLRTTLGEPASPPPSPDGPLREEAVYRDAAAVVDLISRVVVAGLGIGGVPRSRPTYVEEPPPAAAAPEPTEAEAAAVAVRAQKFKDDTVVSTLLERIKLLEDQVRQGGQPQPAPRSPQDDRFVSAA
ncbi:hypothetical protein M885DRAFT_528649 [Pelagophyceae sp. CCMP2097]|nr:hypothetical protein M885DRAFT_528649 [Pelagophyceae sp. CCMP2097]